MTTNKFIPLKFKGMMNNTWLAFHNLLLIIQYIKLIIKFLKMMNNQLNNMIPKKMLMQH